METFENNRMTMTVYDLTVTFTEPVLGTQPQRDVATEFITTKAALSVAPVMGANGELPADEVESLTEKLDKGTTAFHRAIEDGRPIYFDYLIKGFMKEAGLTFNGQRGVKNLRSKIDNLLFVTPRRIVLHVPEGWKPSAETLKEHPEAVTDYLERPLRAMTAQGPRTTVARSEMLPVGTWFTCQLMVLGGKASELSEPLLNDLLSYGAFKGLGQWRNGSYGRFICTLKKHE